LCKSSLRLQMLAPAVPSNVPDGCSSYPKNSPADSCHKQTITSQCFRSTSAVSPELLPHFDID
jgi:hypothetical protein